MHYIWSYTQSPLLYILSYLILYLLSLFLVLISFPPCPMFFFFLMETTIRWELCTKMNFNNFLTSQSQHFMEHFWTYKVSTCTWTATCGRVHSFPTWARRKVHVASDRLLKMTEDEGHLPIISQHREITVVRETDWTAGSLGWWNDGVLLNFYLQIEP